MLLFQYATHSRHLYFTTRDRETHMWNVVVRETGKIQNKKVIWWDAQIKNTTMYGFFICI